MTETNLAFPANMPVVENAVFIAGLVVGYVLCNNNHCGYLLVDNGYSAGSPSHKVYAVFASEDIVIDTVEGLVQAIRSGNESNVQISIYGSDILYIDDSPWLTDEALDHHSEDWQYHYAWLVRQPKFYATV